MTMQYSIRAAIVLHTTVLVEADSEEEARLKFEGGVWDDNGYDSAERVDWHAKAKPQAER